MKQVFGHFRVNLVFGIVAQGFAAGLRGREGRLQSF
jgi:hypothetical protein